MISRGSGFRLAVFLLCGLGAPGLAWASRPSLSDLATISLEARDLPELPSSLELAAREQHEHQACGAFCGEPLRLELVPPPLFGRARDPWRVFSLELKENTSSLSCAEGDAFLGRGPFGGRDALGICKYANANPTTFTDPTGHFSIKDFGKGAVNVVLEPFRQVADIAVAGIATYGMGIDAEDIQMTSMLGKAQRERVVEGQSGGTAALKGVGETAFAVGTVGIGPAAVSHVQLAQAYNRGELTIDQYDAALSEIAGGQAAAAAIAKVAGGRSGARAGTEIQVQPKGAGAVRIIEGNRGATAVPEGPVIEMVPNGEGVFVPAFEAQGGSTALALGRPAAALPATSELPALLPGRAGLARPTAGFGRYVAAESRIGTLPTTLTEMADQIRLDASVADLQARASGLPRTQGRFGTRAHSVLESTELQRQQGLARAGSNFSLAPEEYRDSAGNVVGRRAPGSRGLDVMLYQQGTPLHGFDLKTGRPWTAAELAEIQRRFGVPVTQIKTK